VCVCVCVCVIMVMMMTSGFACRARHRQSSDELSISRTSMPSDVERTSRVADHRVVGKLTDLWP